MKLRLLALSVLIVATTGCSTITQDSSQSLALTSSYQGQPVEAECKLSNDKGQWNSKTPSNVIGTQVKRRSGCNLQEGRRA